MERSTVLSLNLQQVLPGIWDSDSGYAYLGSLGAVISIETSLLLGVPFLALVGMVLIIF